MDNEYVIVGDTDIHKECLVYVCGSSEQRAKQILERMLNNPNENDEALKKGHSNLRIKLVPKKCCWWNQSGLDFWTNYFSM